MSITPVDSLNGNSASVTGGTTSSSTGSAINSTLSVDFTQYLKILTAQLQNQDPTNATDPNQFTQELIQIEQVQVQNNTNTDLEALTNSNATNALATGVSYIGNYVQANTSDGTFSLQGGTAELGYGLATASAATVVTIKDAAGDTVASLEGGTAAGGNYVTWDGKDSSGNQLADGIYSFTTTAVDTSGNTVDSGSPVALFKVTSVQSNGDGSLQLLAGSLSLPTTDVTNLYNSSTLPKATALTAISSSTSS